MERIGGKKRSECSRDAARVKNYVYFKHPNAKRIIKQCAHREWEIFSAYGFD